MRKNRAMSAPRVLSFDLDDTLWPVGPVIAAAEEALLSWLQARYPRAVGGHTIESLRALRAQVAARFPEHGHDMTFLRRRALEELFAAAGHAETLAYTPWPEFDAALVKDETVEIGVQVNGKLRARIKVPAGVDAETLEQMARADERVAGFLSGKKVVKVVVIPGKLVNFVVAGGG